MAIVAWAVAAVLLLDDSVPRGLAPPQIDVDATFGKELVDEAGRYERFLVVDWLLAQVVLLAVLWVYARRGVAFVQQSAAGRIGTGMLLGMLGLGMVWILHLPFGLAALWWERRHDTTEIGYVEWALGDWLELGANFLAISLALLIVMALAGWLSEWWWIPGAARLRRYRRAAHLRQPLPRHHEAARRRRPRRGGKALRAGAREWRRSRSGSRR